MDLTTNKGWIRIHRKLVDWEWYGDPKMVRLWLHLLLSANYEDKKWRGITIPRGSLKTSLSELAVETGLTVREVRTCMNRLKSTNEVTQQTTHQFSIITICKYDDYQIADNYSDTQSDTPSDIQATHERHTSDTPSKEIPPIPPKENIEKINNINTHTVTRAREGVEYFGTFRNVELKPVELRTLQMNFGEKETAEAIDDLSCNLMDGTKQSYAHYATLTRWLSHRRRTDVKANGYKGDSTIGKEFTRKS